MTSFQWLIVAILGGAVYGLGWGMDRILKKLNQLIDIAERIRIQDRKRD